VVNIRPIPELVEYFVQHFAASMDKTKPSRSKRRAAWFVTPGLGTFESCKTTLKAVSSFLVMASLNQRYSRDASRWRQRLQIRRLKKKCEEKFSQPASAPTGSSGVREEQPPDSA